MIDKPLYQNPLSGGLGGVLEAPAPTYNELQGDALVKQIQGRMMQQDVKSPAFNAFASEVMKTKGYPTKTIQEYSDLFPNNLITQNSLLGATMPSQEEGMPGASGSNTPLDPQADIANIIGDPFKLKSDDPLMQGYYDSDFYSNTMTMDMVPYTFQGKEMMGSSSGASNLKKYLESIGKGNLLQFKNNNLMSQEGLSQVDTPEQLIESGQFTPGVGQDIFGNNPAEIAVPSTPNPIQGIGLDSAPINSYNRVGQQLTGPNQDDILGTLKNIEQGIMSLGQGNMNQSSFGGFNNNFGIGSFFPPYGGMYGK